MSTLCLQSYPGDHRWAVIENSSVIHKSYICNVLYSSFTQWVHYVSATPWQSRMICCSSCSIIGWSCVSGILRIRCRRELALIGRERSSSHRLSQVLRPILDLIVDPIVIPFPVSVSFCHFYHFLFSFLCFFLCLFQTAILYTKAYVLLQLTSAVYGNHCSSFTNTPSHSALLHVLDPFLNQCLFMPFNCCVCFANTVTAVYYEPACHDQLKFDEGFNLISWGDERCLPFWTLGRGPFSHSYPFQPLKKQ